MIKSNIYYSCTHCGIDVLFHRGKKNKYCSVQCQQDFALKKRIESGTASHRTLKRYLLGTFGNKCSVCGITEWNSKPIVLEMEHLDGNSDNGSLDNICLICPNCHSQTPTYKAKNKGNGRHYRRVRYKEGKSF